MEETFWVWFLHSDSADQAHLCNNTEGITFEPENGAVKMLVHGVHVAYVSSQDAPSLMAFMARYPRYTIKVPAHISRFGKNSCLEITPLSE